MLDRLRAFLDEHADRPRFERSSDKLAWQRAWHADLADAGLAAPSWPKDVGGLDLSVEEQLEYHRLMTGAKAPAHPSPMSMIVAPTIIKHGTPAQRDRFLRPLLRADELWCQGFSEPEAGSDLPSLRTKAVLDGDHYVVSGQKVWTSNAHISDWMFALVRTGEPGTRGISYLLIKMDSPGLTTRPLRDMIGGTKFSEVFLDNVRVPLDQRIGPENGGWPITKTSLGHERTTMSLASDFKYRRIVNELFTLADRTGQLEDPVTRQLLAGVVIGVRILAANAERTLSAVLAGGEPGAAASANRLFRAEFEQRLHEVGLSLLGTAGMLAASDPAVPERGRWTYGYLATRASTIGAGTSEIQRNSIAENVLGLPRG